MDEDDDIEIDEVVILMVDDDVLDNDINDDEVDVIELDDDDELDACDVELVEHFMYIDDNDELEYKQI